MRSVLIFRSYPYLVDFFEIASYSIHKYSVRSLTHFFFVYRTRKCDRIIIPQEFRSEYQHQEKSIYRENEKADKNKYFTEQLREIKTKNIDENEKRCLNHSSLNQP